MKYHKIIIPIFFLIVFSGFSQHSEIGLQLGTSYYLGELNPSIHVVNKPNPSFGVFYRKNMSKRYSLRVGANYARLGAGDNISSTELSESRDLSFSTTLLEGYGVLEFNFIPYQINNYSTSSFTPYVFIGVAAFYAYPSDIPGLKEVIDENIDGVTAPSVPFGLGVKFNFVENLGLGIEWGMRKTFTDKVDGMPATYSNGYQLSNSQNNDWYSILGVTLNYKFLTKRDNCPGVIN